MARTEDKSTEMNAEKCIYKTKNIYLASFLISQDNFQLGKIYIEDLKKDNKAFVEIEYDAEFEDLLNNYIDVYQKKHAICKLHTYQENIRFIMHVVNMRKSGIDDEVEIDSRT